jgi:hypothetical protein
VQGILHSESYITLGVNSGVIENMNRIYGKMAWVFQDDGASAHRAKKTMEVLASFCSTLSSTLHWHAHSSDLNVIEYIWGILKQRMNVAIYETEDDLWFEAVRVWDEIAI